MRMILQASHHNFLCIWAACQALDITIHNSFCISVIYYIFHFIHLSTQCFLSSLFLWSTWHSVNLFLFCLLSLCYCKSLNDMETFLSSWIYTKCGKNYIIFALKSFWSISTIKITLRPNILETCCVFISQLMSTSTLMVDTQWITETLTFNCTLM